MVELVVVLVKLRLNNSMPAKGVKSTAVIHAPFATKESLHSTMILYKVNTRDAK
jgi:hypothetical protein